MTHTLGKHVRRVDESAAAMLSAERARRVAAGPGVSDGGGQATRGWKRWGCSEYRVDTVVLLQDESAKCNAGLYRDCMYDIIVGCSYLGGMRNMDTSVLRQMVHVIVSVTQCLIVYHTIRRPYISDAFAVRTDTVAIKRTSFGLV